MAVDKITYKECRAALFHHIGEKLQRHINVGSPAFRFEIYDFPYYKKYMLTACLGRNILLDFVGEENHADLVIVLYR